MPPATRTLAAGPCTGAVGRRLVPGPCTGAVRRRLVAGPCRGAVALCLLVLAACSSGSTSDGSATSSSAPSPSAPASTAGSSGADGGDLVIEVDRGDGGAPQRYTLSCGGPVSGDLPDAAAACDHLRGLDDPFAALPAGTVCSQLFGGPQTAQVTGTWAGRPVDLSLARRNGCEIAQWDSLGPLLPGPVG